MNGLLVENPTTYPDHLWTYYPDGSFVPYVNLSRSECRMLPLTESERSSTAVALRSRSSFMRQPRVSEGFDAAVNMDLARVLKGLSFHTQFAADYSTSYNTSFDNEYAVFIPTWLVPLRKYLPSMMLLLLPTVSSAASALGSIMLRGISGAIRLGRNDGYDVITDLKKEGIDKKSGVQNVGNSTDNQTISFNADFSYRNTFNRVHNVDAMILASGWQKTLSGVYHRTSNVNLGIRAAYDYAGRYFADFQAAVVHSAKLAPGHRSAFSPSLTLGWRMKDDLLRNATAVVPTFWTPLFLSIPSFLRSVMTS